MGRRAAERAITKLSARPAPSARFPLWSALVAVACCSTKRVVTVSKPTWSARGVGLREPGRRAGRPPLVTLIDDGTMAGEWGHFAIDDEGRPAGHNVLIQDGVLTDYMWDQLRARKEGRLSSGTAAARATSTSRWCG